ncbi:DUF5680 domain-containing protein [Clostridium intestinale]|uniref:Transcriptional regulator, contains XRE-family HTH domain n=1 Tax=Clostridium intestinale DSM 6191 TaxID=1121320 RepID=A0A1M5VWD4_9CLOT|nr:DUF5680 domain-containing protein [Clostridium intestinale]SHH79521.1 Transcriptional regulator, contains XRE-family HTH domain [Clostridium intestinale DSM 6191]
MSFKDKLQSIRKEKGLSQESIAEKIGVSRQAVAKWEIGQSYPDVENLILISDMFKISIDKLVKEAYDECEYNDKKEEKEIDDNIIEFLCRAKKVTYAGKGAKVESSRPKSHDFEHSEGELKYIDTYLGGEIFLGEEGIWKDNTPIWAMNYKGRVLGEGFSGDFLKETLALVNKEMPYRGPLVYENGDYKYHCIVQGDFKWFKGYEEIFYNNKKVYECMFHGGAVK